MLRVRLIEDWRSSWKKGSVWLACAAGAAAPSILAAAPGLIQQAVTAPLVQRIVIGVLIGFALTASAWSSRILSVSKKEEPDADA